jgi:hypothetical protein
MINFDLVTGWLKLCDGTHEHTINPSNPISQLQDLRFIDVRNRCIVKQNHSVRYAALSYTWGRGKQYCLKRKNVEVLEEHGSLDRVDIPLRRVIFDAIEVCVRADIPYLWVDALCIVQDDTHGKMAQISKMNLIYSNAYVTIIAAAEKQEHLIKSHVDQTVDTGLPRVSTPITPVEPSFTIDGAAYSSDSYYIYKTLNRNFSTSKWFSRGW